QRHRGKTKGRIKGGPSLSRDDNLLIEDLFLEGDVHQQLVAFDLNDVAEGAAALAGKVEAYAAVADAQVADAQMLQPLRQHGIQDIQFALGSAGAQAQHGAQDQEHGA